MLVLLLACQPSDGRDSATPADSGTTDSADPDTGAGDGLPTDFAPCGEAEAQATYTLLETDTARYAALDQIVETWELRLTCDGVEYEYPLGGTPTFRVIRPAAPDPSVPRPLALMFHPGTVDVDTEEYPEGVYGGACADDHGPERVDHYLDMSVFTPYFVHRGGVVAIPVNSFCDLWMGLGPADPVDPKHGGAMLAKLVSDWMVYLQDDVAIDESHIVVYGARFAEVGGSLYTAMFPEVDVFVPAGGPSDMVRYYEEEGYCQWEPERCTDTTSHIWGGPPHEEDGSPSAYYDRYRDSSPTLAVSADRYALPILHLYNREDLVSPLVQHDDLGPALAAKLDPLGLRWAEHDFNNIDLPHDGVHNSPASGWLATWFINDHDVATVEGEERAAIGEVGVAGRSALGDGAPSGAAILAATVADGPGTMFRANAPFATSAGQEVRVAFMVKTGSGTGAAARLVLTEDEVEVVALDLAPSDLVDATVGEGIAGFVQNWDTTTLSATSSGGQLGARVDVYGTADVELDLVLFGAR